MRQQNKVNVYLEISEAIIFWMFIRIKIIAVIEDQEQSFILMVRLF